MDPRYIPRDQSDPHRQLVAAPGEPPLRWLAMHVRTSRRGEDDDRFGTADRETVLDILSGTCAIEVRLGYDGPVEAAFEHVGGRTSPFDGPPAMLYLPPGRGVRIAAESEMVEVAVVNAPARADHPLRLMRPEEAQVRTVGQGNWQRTVYTSIGEDVAADRLLVGETVNPPGNWSSAPPHKHDRHGGGEAPMEELYYYRLDPPQGFGLQRIYTPSDARDPFDVVYPVRDGDAVAIPRGYHPVVAAPGYRLFYLWALAGDERRYGAWADDPAHAWVKGT